MGRLRTLLNDFFPCLTYSFDSQLRKKVTGSKGLKAGVGICHLPAPDRTFPSGTGRQLCRDHLSKRIPGTDQLRVPIGGNFRVTKTVLSPRLRKAVAQFGASHPHCRPWWRGSLRQSEHLERSLKECGDTIRMRTTPRGLHPFVVTNLKNRRPSPGCGLYWAARHAQGRL